MLKYMTIAMIAVGTASTALTIGGEDRVLHVEDNFTTVEECHLKGKKVEDAISGAILGAIFGSIVDEPEAGAVVGAVAGGTKKHCTTTEVYVDTTVTFVIDGKVYETTIKK